MDRFLPHAVTLAFLSAPIAVLAPLAALAHPGGLDHDGGHVDHKTGQYHLHRLDYSAEAKSRGVGVATPSSRPAPRASAPEHYLAGVGTIPSDLFSRAAPTSSPSPPTLRPSANSPAAPTPTKGGLMMARTG